MVEITGERVTRVWQYGREHYGDRGVLRHIQAWVLAVHGRSPNDTLPPVELVWDGGVVIGVRADV